MPITLPTEKTEPKSDIRDMVTLIYGAPKIGKSSFCAEAEGALFLATEPGLDHLSVYQIPVTRWEEFLEAGGLIARGGHPYRTIIIDTIDNLFIMCRRYVLQKNGWKHEQDGAYGRGYDAVKDEFRHRIIALSMLPYGLMMTSHSKEDEVKTPTGRDLKITPTLPPKARELILGMVDVILYAETREIRDTDMNITGYERVIHTKPTTIYEAGVRERKGLDLPETLPLDYKMFASAIKGAKESSEPSEPIKQAKSKTKIDNPIVTEPTIKMATDSDGSDDYDPFANE